jgi:hypothetical protein
VALYYAVPDSERFPLVPVSFVRCVLVGRWLSISVVVRNLLPRAWTIFSDHSVVLFLEGIPAGCSYCRNSAYSLDVCSRLCIVAVGTLFSACSSGKKIGIVVFSTLSVLGNEVVLLQTMNSAKFLNHSSQIYAEWSVR